MEDFLLEMDCKTHSRWTFHRGKRIEGFIQAGYLTIGDRIALVFDYKAASMHWPRHRQEGVRDLRTSGIRILHRLPVYHLLQ